MKVSHLIAFLSGAALAAGVTMLFTTEKGKTIRVKVSDKCSKEELDKIIAKLKRKRAEVAEEEEMEEAAEVAAE